jgi:hypothetical protein
MDGLDDKALRDFTDFMSDMVIPGLVLIADKHNYDRDDFIRYAANIMSMMAEFATFENYKLPQGESEEEYGNI